jgi:hypothetical protein
MVGQMLHEHETMIGRTYLKPKPLHDRMCERFWTPPVLTGRNARRVLEKPLRLIWTGLSPRHERYAECEEWMKQDFDPNVVDATGLPRASWSCKAMVLKTRKTIKNQITQRPLAHACDRRSSTFRMISPLTAVTFTSN